MMVSLSLTQSLLLSILFFTAYSVTLTVYRLYFHALSKFPATRWFEFYHNVIRRGKFIFEIQAMHDKYGPIVRIAPDELHINDPEWYDELYGSATRKRDKSPAWVVIAGGTGSAFATEHAAHRVRRATMNPLFSKRSVIQLDLMLQEKIEKLAERFRLASLTGEIIRADAAYTALTFDVIS